MAVVAGAACSQARVSELSYYGYALVVVAGAACSQARVSELSYYVYALVVCICADQKKSLARAACIVHDHVPRTMF